MAVRSITADTRSGAGPGGYSPAYGGVPQVPNLIDVYGTAVGANKQFLPQVTELGRSISGNTEEELLNNLRLALPGYDASVSKSMGNIGSLQSGQIPLDVKNLIAQQAAERGVATGLYDSPNANAALLRSLGLTSLGLQGEGEKQMTALVGRTPQAQPFDISKLMLNPTDLYESNLLSNIYNRGRANVPSYSGGSTMPNLSTPPSIVRSEPANPAAVGALGPFPSAKVPPITVPTGNLRAGGGGGAGLVWDPQMGMYYNQYTHQYVNDESAVLPTIADEFQDFPDQSQFSFAGPGGNEGGDNLDYFDQFYGE